MWVRLCAMILLMTGIAAGAVVQDVTSTVAAGIEAYNRGNAAAAFDLLKAAADTGDPDAQVNLGHLYSRGHGVAADKQQAMRLYRASARQGNAEGMNALGFEYRFGSSAIQADLEQAVYWLCRAAVSGDERGLNNLGVLHFEGKGMPRDVEEYRSLWRQAADRGDPNAMYNLGMSLMFGPEPPLDHAAGMQWLVKSAQLGNGRAQQVVRKEGYRGELPDPRDTQLIMRVASKKWPPGKARYCGSPA